MVRKIPQFLFDNSRSLRHNQTPWEWELWYHLRAKRFLELKFKRQVRIGKYITDFCCDEKKVIIELDGGQHNEVDKVSLDKKRDLFLQGQGYKIFRVWNNEIERNLEGVLEHLKTLINT